MDITQEHFILVLRKHIGERSIRTAAKGWGVSAAYLSDVLRGNRIPGPRISATLGYERRISRQIVFRPIAKKAKNGKAA